MRGKVGLLAGGTVAVLAFGFAVAVGSLQAAPKDGPSVCTDFMSLRRGGRVIVGTSGNDVLTGTQGSDLIEGLGGNDTIMGGTGADVVCGGDGDDRIVTGDDTLNDVVSGDDGDDVIVSAGLDIVMYWYAPRGIRVDLTSRDGTATGWGNDTLTSVGRVVGSPYADTFLAPAGGSEFAGLAGDDVFVGAGGDDVFIGGAGDDRLDGGLDDTFGDTADFRAGLWYFLEWYGVDFPSLYLMSSDYPVTVNLASGRGTGVGHGTDRLSGIENVSGSAKGDRIVGDSGPNEMYGLGGADRLDGRGGRDYLHGNVGNDVLYGRAGRDDLRGNEGNDVLFGGPGADELNGGRDDDRGNGGPGRDFCSQVEHRTSCP